MDWLSKHHAKGGAGGVLLAMRASLGYAMQLGMVRWWQ